MTGVKSEPEATIEAPTPVAQTGGPLHSDAAATSVAQTGGPLLADAVATRVTQTGGPLLTDDAVTSVAQTGGPLTAPEQRPQVVEATGPLGKYLELGVPAFNSYDGGAPMTSYLRLGAVKNPSQAGAPGAPKATGEDLASYITSFIDDTRVREGCPHYVSPGDRQAETARLHLKGGWRDHSDGNRVSTTRGDKVEVVRGNYRMVVLNRRDDTDYEAGWDVSGGHVCDSGITFAPGTHSPLETGISWVENYDGTWRVVEDSSKGDVFTTYHGDTHDWYYGKLKQSTTGSPAPAKDKENPEIFDETWAVSITSYTGSAALPVPSIKDETWAQAISSVTTADAISDETTATSISSITTADAISDETTATTISSKTVAETVSDHTTADTVSSTTIGNVEDTTIGDSTSTIIGDETETLIGSMTEITVGDETSITLGKVIDITMALMLDITLAASLDIKLGVQVEFDAEAKYDITPKAIKTALDNTEVSAKKDYIAGVHNFL